MVNFKLSNENNVKSELINMTQAWNKEKSESPPGVQEVMDSFPIRDSDFSLFHTHVMLISSLFTLNTLHNTICNYHSSNHRLESAGLNALEELLFRCWQ